MNGLADDLAAALEGEPLGLSGRELRRRIGRRHVDVLAALQSDPRFRHHGDGRGSRWRIATEPLISTPWETQGTEDLPQNDLDPSGIPVIWKRAEI